MSCQQAYLSLSHLSLSTPETRLQEKTWRLRVCARSCSLKDPIPQNVLWKRPSSRTYDLLPVVSPLPCPALRREKHSCWLEEPGWNLGTSDQTHLLVWIRGSDLVFGRAGDCNIHPLRNSYKPSIWLFLWICSIISRLLTWDLSVAKVKSKTILSQPLYSSATCFWYKRYRFR